MRSTGTQTTRYVQNRVVIGSIRPARLAGDLVFLVMLPDHCPASLCKEL